MRAAAEGAKGATMVRGEYVEGVIAGKNYALREWQLKREGRDFKKLCNSLKVLKWQRENPEKVAAKMRRHYQRPGVKEKQLAAARKRRARQYAKNPVVVTCACGATWCRAPWAGSGKPQKWCSSKCELRHRYANDANYRAAVKRNAAKAYARKRAEAHR